MTGQPFDRSAQDVGNIVALEHVNVRIPDQQTATAFYIVGLGLTRDPYLMVGLENMWANVGWQQFHLPTGGPQVMPGRVGLVMPDLDALAARLASVKARLEGTRFDYRVEPEHVDVTCPWGNRIRVHAPAPRFGHMRLGMPYVELPVARGAADGIARFYTEIMGAGATVTESAAGRAAEIRVGAQQAMIFRETSDPVLPYDGHHVAIYISDFSGPYRRLGERGLVTLESNPYEYRFQRIVDLDTGKLLHEIEHEVRSVTHPMYRRPLVNRNPAQRQSAYQPGRDAFAW
ncbi:MAG TPA: hypothetical protein VNN07_12700 [Candidatus Tectomicrobia bacterium]|nr:hypothetical protein [Candidatus Tectomicrobia bacterium]